MRDDLEIIDADFEVIEPAYADRNALVLVDDDHADAPPIAEWTFWDNDFPNLFGLAAGLATLFAVRWLFKH